jgi:hypothetical protein
LDEATHKLRLNEEHVHAGRNTTLDELGIAKTAREEKLRARDEKLKHGAEQARMEKLYRQHILKEPQPEGGFVPLTAIAPAGASKAEEKEEVFGD